MRILKDIEGGYWTMKAFEDDHNNNFVSPIKRIKMRSNRVMPESAKKLKYFEMRICKLAKLLRFLEVLISALKNEIFITT